MKKQKSIIDQDRNTCPEEIVENLIKEKGEKKLLEDLQTLEKALDRNPGEIKEVSTRVLIGVVYVAKKYLKIKMEHENGEC